MFIYLNNLSKRFLTNCLRGISDSSQVVYNRRIIGSHATINPHHHVYGNNSYNLIQFHSH